MISRKVVSFEEIKERIEKGGNLDLWSKRIFSRNLINLLPRHSITGKSLGDDGCEAIAGLLKTNTTLTGLDLQIIETKSLSSIFI